MKIPSDAKQSDNVINIVPIQERMIELNHKLARGEASQTEQKELRNLIIYLQETTGTKLSQDQGHGQNYPQNMDDIRQRWAEFIGDPEDPYDMPPEYADVPVPEPSPRHPVQRWPEAPPEPRNPYLAPDISSRRYAHGGLVTERAANNITEIRNLAQAMLSRGYAGGGMVNMLPDSMLDSPLLNRQAAAQEMGLRSLLRSTDTDPEPLGGIGSLGDFE